MHEPGFWRDLDPRSRQAAPVLRLLLTPAAMAYAWAGKRRIEQAEPYDPQIPVVCIGNLTLGGAGKTPVTAHVRTLLSARGFRAASLSRGYGGSEAGPLCIDPGAHTVAQVGDEPLMLAQSGETWISRDRAAGAKAMREAGVAAIVLDDGHQNPSVAKSLSLVVIDATDPFGNRHVFPKGPLREPIAVGLARAQAVILMGDGEVPAQLGVFNKPILRARLAPREAAPQGRHVAFAGIGRPERFFDALRAQGVELADAIPYPDHHMFTTGDIRYLDALAAKRDAMLITTEKDLMRLPAEVRARVRVAPVAAVFEDPAALDALLPRRLAAT
jgi:tetraacyldisaccharide 4'-kinase